MKNWKSRFVVLVFSFCLMSASIVQAVQAAQVNPADGYLVFELSRMQFSPSGTSSTPNGSVSFRVRTDDAFYSQFKSLPKADVSEGTGFNCDVQWGTDNPTPDDTMFSWWLGRTLDGRWSSSTWVAYQQPSATQESIFKTPEDIEMSYMLNATSGMNSVSNGLRVIFLPIDQGSTAQDSTEVTLVSGHGEVVSNMKDEPSETAQILCGFQER